MIHEDLEKKTDRTTFDCESPLDRLVNLVGRTWFKLLEMEEGWRVDLVGEEEMMKRTGLRGLRCGRLKMHELSEA